MVKVMKKNLLKKENYEVDEERDFDVELCPCSLTSGSWFRQNQKMLYFALK